MPPLPPPEACHVRGEVVDLLGGKVLLPGCHDAIPLKVWLVQQGRYSHVSVQVAVGP